MRCPTVALLVVASGCSGTPEPPPDLSMDLAAPSDMARLGDFFIVVQWEDLAHPPIDLWEPDLGDFATPDFTPPPDLIIPPDKTYVGDLTAPYLFCYLPTSCDADCRAPQLSVAASFGLGSCEFCGLSGAACRSEPVDGGGIYPQCCTGACVDEKCQP